MNEYQQKISLNELNEIFKENPNDIFKYNTTDCVTLIMPDNTEIPLNEFKSGMKPEFIKITNEDLSLIGNEILIALYWYKTFGRSDNKMSWSDMLKKIQKYQPVYSQYFDIAAEQASHDLNGYKNTIQTLEIANKSGEQFPSIKYCQSKLVTLKNQKYIGYLPSIGQWKIIANHIKLINYLTAQIDNFKIPFFPTGTFWSSTEYSQSKVFAIKIVSGNSSMVYQHDKDVTIAWVLPIFKKIN